MGAGISGREESGMEVGIDANREFGGEISGEREASGSGLTGIAGEDSGGEICGGDDELSAAELDRIFSGKF